MTAERLWWYISLGASGIVTEEATPLVGGLAAHNGHVHVIAAALTITVGTWIAGMLLYIVGRSRGRWVRRRWPRVRTLMLRTVRIVRRHPWRCALATRWAFGLRIALPLACGAGRSPIAIYAVGSAISAATWSFAFTLLGWGFGHSALLLLGAVRRYENLLIAVILATILVVFVVMRRRHVEEEVVHVLEKEKDRD